MRPCSSPSNLPLHWESVPSQSLELPPPGQPQEQGPDFLLDPGPFPSLLSQSVLASEPAKHPFHFWCTQLLTDVALPPSPCPSTWFQAATFMTTHDREEGYLVQGRDGMEEVEGIKRHILCPVPQLYEEPFRSPGWRQRTWKQPLWEVLVQPWRESRGGSTFFSFIRQSDSQLPAYVCPEGVPQFCGSGTPTQHQNSSSCSTKCWLNIRYN